jgi:periplasmic protein TonB
MKKWLIILLLFFCKINIGVAQNENSDSLKIIEKPDQVAKFQGGMGALGKFLQKNLKYPEKAFRANVTGKVSVKFIVEVDGSLSNFQIEVSPGFGVGEEVIRVLKLSPKWIPAKQKDRKVRSVFRLPIPCMLLSE